MKILKGYVLGVVDKGEGDKRWAIVGIKATDKDRDGFDVDTTYKLRVFGDAVKNGLHNAYRNLAGVESTRPITTSSTRNTSALATCWQACPWP
ncbi:hypothetical protein POW24_18695 [Pseudomonas aeruginosa]|nr:hypothetical protein [Pseudomonas aeruginosa]